MKLKVFLWDVHEVEDKLRFWFEHGKPYHAELLNLLIMPPKFIPDDHICRWDVCTWEHDDIIQCRPVIFIPSRPLFENEPDFALCFRKELFTVSDTNFWDISSWDSMPSRILDFSCIHDTGTFAALEWGDGEASMLFPNLWDEAKWDYASTFTRIVGSEFIKGLSLTADFIDSQNTGAFSLTDVICDNRPQWDSYNWLEHGTWTENFRQEGFIYETTRAVSASLEWNDKREDINSFWDYNFWDNTQYPDEYNAPLQKWSRFKNWKGSKSWNTTTELFASWEITFQEDLI